MAGKRVSSRQLHERHADHVRAVFHLVATLARAEHAPGATAMRMTDTCEQLSLWSGAVSPPIGSRLRQGDVDIATHGSTPPTRTTPGCRTSATATRTTTGRTTSTGCWPSAGDDLFSHADFSFTELTQAYFDCRASKRNKASARAFELGLEHNLRELFDDLQEGRYRPGKSICFVITRPQPREVWAATFRDRVVHHLLYNRVSGRFHRAFIADSCACIPGRGTLYAARRLESKVRSLTQNWSRPAWYLKCDLANFFVSIDKRILHELLAPRIPDPWWRQLAGHILFHDPRSPVELHSPAHRLALIPPHKSLFNQPPHLGLPIGNLSSQFFANVYLDALDQFVKHQIGARHYIRYVDDFVLLHESPQWLNAARDRIDAFLPARLAARLNDSKTVLQPIDRGIDFVGQVIKPWRRTLRRRTCAEAITRTATAAPADFVERANSYFGLMRQASHSHTDRARLARAVLARGHAVNRQLTQTYRRPT